MRYFLVLTLIVLLVGPFAFAQVPAGGPLVTPAQAARLVDKRVTLQMEVKSTGGTLNCYLNSTANFQDAANVAVCATRGDRLVMRGSFSGRFE